MKQNKYNKKCINNVCIVLDTLFYCHLICFGYIIFKNNDFFLYFYFFIF